MTITDKALDLTIQGHPLVVASLFIDPNLPCPSSLPQTCSNEAHTVAKRVVGILLECVHVIFNYHFPKCSNHLNLDLLW